MTRSATPSPLRSPILTDLGFCMLAGRLKMRSCHLKPCLSWRLYTRSFFSSHSTSTTSSSPSPSKSAKSINMTSRPAAPIIWLSHACFCVAPGPGFSNQRQARAAPFRSVIMTSESPSPSISRTRMDMIQPTEVMGCQVHCVKSRASAGISNQPREALGPFPAANKSIDCCPRNCMGCAYIHIILPSAIGRISCCHRLALAHLRLGPQWILICLDFPSWQLITSCAPSPSRSTSSASSTLGVGPMMTLGHSLWIFRLPGWK